MLTSLYIQGFKAIFGASVPLGPFTLIIGRNGSGKSSAIEAIQWLRDATFLGVASATSGEVAFTDLVNKRSDTIAFDLQFQGRYPIHYVLEVGPSQPPGRAIVYYERCTVGRTSGALAVVHSRKGKRGPAYRWIVGGSQRFSVRDGNEIGLKYTATLGIHGAQQLVDFLERAVFLRLSPTAIAAPSRNEPRSWRPLLAEDGHDLASLLLRMQPPQRTRVAKRLQAIFPTVEGLDVSAVDKEIRFTVRERMRSRGGTRLFEIPSPLLSEGMRRLVAIFALLEIDPRPSLLVIEEIENGLDPWTLQHVLDALRKVSGDVQIVLTTHSPFLLDHVDPHEVTHVRRIKGDTTYESVSSIADVARYEGILAPGAMYLSNVFQSGAE